MQNGQGAKIRLSGNFMYKLLLSYLLIVCIPLAIFGVLYQRANRELQRQNRQAVSEQAAYTRSVFESSLVDVSNVLSALLSNEDMSSLVYGRNPIAESRYTCTVLNARRNLYTISLGSPLYEDILFYHKEEGFVISKDVIYLRMELFPEGYEYRHPGYAWDERFFALFDAEHPYSQKWILYPSLDNASSKLLCASAIVGDTYEV